jgi:hypothetical protein
MDAVEKELPSPAEAVASSKRKQNDDPEKKELLKKQNSERQRKRRRLLQVEKKTKRELFKTEPMSGANRMKKHRTKIQINNQIDQYKDRNKKQQADVRKKKVVVSCIRISYVF